MNRRLATTTLHAALLGIAALTAFPLLWMLSASFMPSGEASTFPPPLLPSAPTLEHYRALFERADMGRYLLNSAAVATAVTLVSLFINSLAGYAFAKLRFQGREKVFRSLLAALVIPAQVAMLPLFLEMRALGLVNSYAGVIVPAAASIFGIFLNRKGREAKGVVSKEEVGPLCEEIKTKLDALHDPKDGKKVMREAFVTRELHDGPYGDMAPDLLLGYEKGFRHSWDCATGGVSVEVFTDNTKSWSGDHCVDPRLVPGVFWSNRKISVEDPELVDIAPTVLDMFGVERPGYMKGRLLFSDNESEVEA